ncbi:MAG: pitrilysin family protein [Phycisphaerae bacterium]|jgi:predicted Zn-dependent peptidase|nr:pitrilysin family protein [Phycisphaerae bacterium]
MEVSQVFHTEEFANGLTLVAESVADVSSSAITISLPAGVRFDPEGYAGSAAVLAEWCFRGAGSRDTRGLNDALDALGCQHHENVLSHHMVFSATQLGRNLPAVLEILTDVLRRPRLDDQTFAPSRDLVRQDLDALEDEPARKAIMQLRDKFYPHPLGRGLYGTPESLAALSAEGLRAHGADCMSPAGAIISVAGKFDWDRLRDLVGEYLGDWSVDAPIASEIKPPERGVTHVSKDSAQAHITLAHETVKLSDDQYYASRLGSTVLSGGMSSRLFTEVREKRGLVYHVSSSYHSLKDYAGMFTYAGTVPQKAQETLEVTVGELRRVAEDITHAELAKAKTQLKSSLVMQGESTGARAGAISSDWYHLKRLRSLTEISQAVDAVTIDDVKEHLQQWPARDFSMLVIGPEPLDTSCLTL